MAGRAIGQPVPGLGILGDLSVALDALHVHRVDVRTRQITVESGVGDRAQEIFCLDRLGWLALQNGCPAEALDFLEEGLALAEQIVSRLDQSHLHAGMAAAYQLSGELESAETHASQALKLALEIGQAREEEIARKILSQLHASPL